MKKIIFIAGLLCFFVLPAFIQAQAVIWGQAPYPAQTCVDLKNNLSYGMTDSQTNGEVTLLQNFLRTNGYLNNVSTGYFGGLTLQAVKAAQMAHKVNPTGYVGIITREVIKNTTCGTSPIGIPNSPTGLNVSCNAGDAPTILSWGKTTMANYYALRISNDSDQSAWVNDCSKKNSTDVCQDVYTNSYSFTPASGSNYTWWVHACNSKGCSTTPATSTLSCVGTADKRVILLTPNGGETISASSTYSVTYSTSNIASGTVILVIKDYNNDTVFSTSSSSITGNSYSILIPNLITGHYRMKIEIRDGTKTVSDWSDNTFTIKASENLATPTAITASCSTSSPTASLSWNKITGATYYEVRIDDLSNSWNNNCFSSYPGDICQNKNSTSTTFTKKDGASYRVWVSPCNTNSCGQPQYKDLSCPADAVGGNTGVSVSGKIKIETPNGGESFTPGTKNTFRWTFASSTDWTTYNLKLKSRYTCFSGPACVSGQEVYPLVSRLKGNSYDWTSAQSTIGSVPTGSYKLEVCDQVGNCDLSDSYFFIPSTYVEPEPLSNTPEKPTNLVASCDSSGSSVTVSWSSVTGATSYLLRGDNLKNSWINDCANKNIGDVCQTVSSPIQIFTSEPGGSYAWWVHACNSAGCSNAVSGRPFTCAGTSTIPNTVTYSSSTVPLAPTGLVASCAAGAKITASWNPVSSATYYWLRADNIVNPWNNNASCTNMNTGDLCLNSWKSTSYQTVGAPGATYNWWVHSCNTTGCSDAKFGTKFTCPAQ